MQIFSPIWYFLLENGQLTKNTLTNQRVPLVIHQSIPVFKITCKEEKSIRYVMFNKFPFNHLKNAQFTKNIKNVFSKLRKLFNFTLKSMDFSTSTSEAYENVFSFVFKLLFVSLGVCIYVQYFFNAVRNQS